MSNHRLDFASFPAWLALALMACAGTEPAEPARSSGGEVKEATKDDQPAAAPAPDLAAHMQASLWMAVRARDSLIAGDLKAAQRAADSLAAQDYSQLLLAGVLLQLDDPMFPVGGDPRTSWTNACCGIRSARIRSGTD